MKHHEPVAVLADTHSLDDGLIHERYTTLQYLLHAVAGGVPFKVILAIPELEAVFFEAPEMLTRVFPHVDLSSHLMLYKTQPKQALAFLFKQGGGPKNLAPLLDALMSAELDRPRAVAPIGELIAFAEEMAPAGEHQHSE